MAKILQLLPIIFFILIIYSCDCIIHVTGVIFDKETGLPIDSVVIAADTADLDNSFNGKTLSESNGIYDYQKISGSCNKVTLYFSKKGYKSLRIETRNNSNDTIKMIKN